jgi:hypothetical protein
MWEGIGDDSMGLFEEGEILESMMEDHPLAPPSLAVKEEEDKEDFDWDQES